MADSAEKLVSERERALFDRIAAKYARKDIAKSSALARRYQVIWAVSPVLQKLGREITIVELGCGAAAPARYLDGRYGRYIGVDYSSEMIQAARVLHRENSKVGFQVGDVTALVLPDNTAHLVLAVGVLHHIPNVKRVLASVRRIGKPGGWFIAIEPQRANPIIQLLRLIRGLADSSYSREQRFFSKQELLTLLESAGFENITVEYQGFFSKPFGQVILPLAPVSNFLSWLAVATDRWLDQHLPRPLRFLAWDLVVRAQFPLE